MRHHRPQQWYGTQYVPSADGASWVLYDFDPTAVSDADKAADIERAFPRKERPAR